MQKSRGSGLVGDGGRGVGVGRGGGAGLIGSNVGGRGDVGYGGCEPRIEGIVKCTKKVLYNIKKKKKLWGRGRGNI